MAYNLTTEFQESWIQVMGGIALVCSTVACPLNAISLSYFLNQNHKTVSSLLYIIVNSVDIVIGVESLIYGVTMTTKLGPRVFTVGHVCDVVGVIWYGVEKLSIFAVVLMNVTRTISIYQPFLAIKKRAVIVPMVALSSIPCLYFGYVFLRGGSFDYRPSIGICNHSTDKVFDLSSVLYQAVFGTMILVSYVLPMFIMLTCLVLSTIKLLKTRKQNGTPCTASKNRATVTILILGLVYTILNIPYSFIYLGYLLHEWNIFDDSQNPFILCNSLLEYKALVIFFDFATIVTVMLNPAINIMVCVLRVRNLREYALNCLRRICGGWRRRERKVFGPTNTSPLYNLRPEAGPNSGTQNSAHRLSLASDNDIKEDNLGAVVLTNVSADECNKVTPQPPEKRITRRLPKIPNIPDCIESKF